MTTKHPMQRGFTLVELSIAIVFVAILTLAILTISLQMMKMYSKGVTLKSINQVARDVGDQLTRDLRAANGKSIKSGPQRFCLGTVSYLWNTPAILGESPGSADQITFNGQPIRFVRVSDPGGNYCSSSNPMVVNSSGNPSEMLGDTTNNLAVHSMNLTQLSPTGSVAAQQLYQLDYTIGTADTSALNGAGASATCKPPTDASANFDFCTVSQFTQVIKVSQGSQ